MTKSGPRLRFLRPKTQIFIEYLLYAGHSFRHSEGKTKTDRVPAIMVVP